MKITVEPATSTLTTIRRKASNRPALGDLPTFASVLFRDGQIWFTLSDGRTILVPLAWSKRLQQATVTQREQFTLSAYNVFWDELDEIIGVENVLYGRQGLYL